MSIIFLLIGIAIALALLSILPKIPNSQLKAAAAALACLAIVAGLIFSSFRYVRSNEVGIVVKNALGAKLPAGKIIATNGEMGPQAKVLPPGWHLWLWPVIFDIDYVPVTEIEEGLVGILTAADGQPLPPGAVYAPEWQEDGRKRMAEDATYFLTDGNGYKGPQTTVLTPGSYRINTKLFKIEKIPVTNIERATVGVVKSNVGTEPPLVEGKQPILVSRQHKGIWKEVLTPGKYNINSKAYEITMVTTRESIADFTKSASTATDEMDRQITVRTSDAFEFPVDVRVRYKIEQDNASMVVARLQDDDENMLRVLQASVRSIFRNNAQDVKALDYVQQRVQQESRSLEMLTSEMEQYGITINAVLIADLGDDSERWQNLLKTQTDREIALQEQETYKEQQRAAEQKKELTRTEQEAEEEKRLATAKYEVQIAEETKAKLILEAGAEAEAIKIRALAQADAYKQIAEQIGKSNAALVEILKIVGEKGIQITPRVMVTGNTSDGLNGGETTALIGTMLDSMVEKPERP